MADAPRPDRLVHPIMLKPLTPLALSAVLLAGCGGGSAPYPELPEPDQTVLCEVNDWRKESVAAACKPGQKVIYLPQTWGNEQLPAIFAALNCDMRLAVALTRGAVACIYAPLDADKKQG